MFPCGRQYFFLTFIKVILQFGMQRVIALSASILAQLYYLCKIYLCKDKKRKLITLINTLQLLTPQQLVNKVNNTSYQGGLEICKGKLYAGESCQSVLNPELAIAYSALFEGQFKERAARSELLKITQPSYMTLSGQNNIKLKIYETHKSVILPTRVMRFKGRSILQKISNTVKRIFGKNSHTQKLQLNEFYNHQNVYELFIPEGSECTVLGKFGKEGKQVVCKSPEMMFPNQKQMMRYIKQSVKSLNVINVLLAIGVIVSTILLLKQMYKIAKSMGQTVRKSSTFANVKRIFQRNRMCSLCNSNLSCVYFMKCKHMSICQECRNRENGCGECDQKDGEWVEMYVC